MQASAVSAPPKRLFRAFRRNNRGSAAVEFSLIAVPFFALFFAIVETGIVFFASQVLETGIQDSGRLLFTHQAQDAGMTATQFKADLCNRVSVLMNCTGVDIDVKYYAAASTITITDPIDSGGNYDPSGLGYTTAPPGSTGPIGAGTFYPWPHTSTVI